MCWRTLISSAAELNLPFDNEIRQPPEDVVGPVGFLGQRVATVPFLCLAVEVVVFEMRFGFIRILGVLDAAVRVVMIGDRQGRARERRA